MAKVITVPESLFLDLFNQVEDHYTRERRIADQQQDIITGKLINNFLYDLENLKRRLQE